VNEIGQILELVAGLREWLPRVVPAELLAGNEWVLWVAAGLVVVIAVMAVASAFGD
jgi:hypothetical protein